MNKRLIFLVLATILPGVAAAQSAEKYRCTNGDLVRRVEIVYATADGVPCEVQYFKDTEAPGDSQVLWNAVAQSGYCESKTSNFIVELEGWGWDCGQNKEAVEEIEADVTEDAQPMDDTEALSAGDEAEE